VRHVRVRRLVSLGVAITAAAVLSLNAVAQGGGHAQVRGSRAVGVLLLRDRHPFCTASIVDSPRGNLILTAAHCLGRRLAPTLMFAPYYHGGRAPLGEWHVTSQVFPPGWQPYGNENEDFAFMTVRGDVQARAGAERLGFSSPVPAQVRVEAYSLTGALRICSRRPGTITAAGQQQLSFACPGYASASSGGPFLTGVHGHSGLGTIVGIIGGYQDGGQSPSVSYSSPFGPVLHEMYDSMTHVTGLTWTQSPTGLR
jgi:Trypsin